VFAFARVNGVARACTRTQAVIRDADLFYSVHHAASGFRDHCTCVRPSINLFNRITHAYPARVHHRSCIGDGDRESR